MAPFISKSNFVNAGLKCPLVLWATFNDRSLLPVDPGMQFVFKQGHEVGDLAKTLFPDGIEIHYDPDFTILTNETKKSLKLGKPIFEASFQTQYALCRADILIPVKNGHDMVEVKASNSISKDNIWDVAFQIYVLEKSGIKIRDAYVMHLDREYTKKGKINAKKIFVKENVTEKARELVPQIEPLLKQFLKIIRGRRPDPILKIECTSPSSCIIHREKTPELIKLFGNTGYKLIKQGIDTLKAVPDSMLSEEEQEIKKAEVTRKPFVEKKKLKQFIDSLNYPLHFLDFETISTAIPLFDDTRPWQNIPFQLSLHIIDKKGEKPRHIEYLSTDDKDPRQNIINALKKVESKGDILAYNMTFEKGVIEKLHQDFPNEKWLKKLLPRIKDLLDPFKQMMVYYPGQQGSNSLKKTLPAVTGKTYENLEINEGGLASQQFCQIMLLDQPGDKEKLRKNLLEYCKQDTEGMIEILDELTKLI